MSIAIKFSVLFLIIHSHLIAQEDIETLKAQYRLLLETNCKVGEITFSTDGLNLAYSCGGDISFSGLRDSSPQVITTAEYVETNPQWSPDGTKIAYQKDSSGVSSIWVYSTISKVHTRVTKIRENTFDPSWAPNGRSIAFSTDSYGSVDVMIKDFDFNKERRLTAAQGDEFIFGFHPSGKYVGYYERGTEEEDIYVVTLTGKEALPITRSENLEYEPKWSYDGSKVIYYLKGATGKSIYTADFPYGELNSLGTHQFEVDPIISANGKRVIYQKQKDGQSDLYIYTINSKETLPLRLDELKNISRMTWSLGGRIIALTTNEPEGGSKIWLVNISQFLQGR